MRIRDGGRAMNERRCARRKRQPGAPNGKGIVMVRHTASFGRIGRTGISGESEDTPINSWAWHHEMQEIVLPS